MYKTGGDNQPLGITHQASRVCAELVKEVQKVKQECQTALQDRAGEQSQSS